MGRVSRGENSRHPSLVTRHFPFMNAIENLNGLNQTRTVKRTGNTAKASISLCLITAQDVEAAAAKGAGLFVTAAAADGQRWPAKSAAHRRGARRHAGARYPRGSQTQAPVAILDDDKARWGTLVQDVPIVGGINRLQALFAEGAFDAAVITVGKSIHARVKLRQLCAAHGIPLANAIDRTAVLLSDVKIGTGNIICAMCHFGNSTVIGDNNFISAHSSFDHHNVLGSDFNEPPESRHVGSGDDWQSSQDGDGRAYRARRRHRRRCAETGVGSADSQVRAAATRCQDAKIVTTVVVPILVRRRLRPPPDSPLAVSANCLQHSRRCRARCLFLLRGGELSRSARTRLVYRVRPCCAFNALDCCGDAGSRATRA